MRPARRPAVAGWTQLLDLEEFEGYWQCTAISWLRLRERRFYSWTRGQRHLYTLAARRPDLLPAIPATRAGQRDSLNEPLHLLHLHVVPLANRLALTALLTELAEQLAATRDLARQAAGNRSPQALEQIQRQLITTGLDSQIVAADIVRYANDEQSWRHDLLDFTQVLPSALTDHPTHLRRDTGSGTVRPPDRIPTHQHHEDFELGSETSPTAGTQ
jgi:hypothetical protein